MNKPVVESLKNKLLKQVLLMYSEYGKFAGLAGHVWRFFEKCLAKGFDLTGQNDWRE